MSHNYYSLPRIVDQPNLIDKSFNIHQEYMALNEGVVGFEVQNTYFCLDIVKFRIWIFMYCFRIT